MAIKLFHKDNSSNGKVKSTDMQNHGYEAQGKPCTLIPPQRGRVLYPPPLAGLFGFAS